MTSRLNRYQNARARAGGCVAIQGLATADFKHDTFYNCSAVTGGAIYGQDFTTLHIADSRFTNNTAFAGTGESIYAQRFEGTMKLERLHFDVLLNAVHLEEGGDLQATHLQLARRWPKVNLADKAQV